MREIKFRGKDIETNEWVYGYYSKINILTQNKDCIIERAISTCYDQFDINSYNEINIKTLGQYTGEKDKNGNEIYEGDIVLVYKEKDEVAFSNGCFFMIKQMFNYEFTYQNFDEIEVIGNIYDNPELLEEEE